MTTKPMPWSPTQKMRAALAGSLVFMTLACLAVMVVTNNAEGVYFVTGNILGAMLTAVTFYFGSSQGSDDKTEALTSMARAGDGDGSADVETMEVDADDVEVRVSEKPPGGMVN